MRNPKPTEKDLPYELPPELLGTLSLLPRFCPEDYEKSSSQYAPLKRYAAQVFTAEDGIVLKHEMKGFLDANRKGYEGDGSIFSLIQWYPPQVVYDDANDGMLAHNDQTQSFFAAAYTNLFLFWVSSFSCSRSNR
ncbi:hypothetical protein M422DRAFT_33518 [Sphaerobolus stellatus SS14]|uniref:Uncharacterized protein n=1 Tax=Sphaerobolus stellatus (strain SS14) TaxID=990650 RepID=A0A0C9V913_SPHS4|nr:hypothetical protein M422DRAFT_33518 [Sphaerobolus stellatus SS14]